MQVWGEASPPGLPQPCSYPPGHPRRHRAAAEQSSGRGTAIAWWQWASTGAACPHGPVSYTHLRAHETSAHL
eukprot:1518850-Alexandrium_andersonii.AAC.1